MSIVNKINLVDYIISKYAKEYGVIISQIKLQKGLYLMYKEWGSKILITKKMRKTEADFNYDIELFDAINKKW